jgi:undecaprenyl-diphosphatase
LILNKAGEKWKIIWNRRVDVNEILIGLDHRLFLAVNNGLASQWLDPLMALACQMGTVRVVYPLSVALFYLYDRPRFSRGMMALAAVLFLNIFVGGILKDVVSRDRPQEAVLASTSGTGATVRNLYISPELPFVAPYPSDVSWQGELGLGKPRGQSFPSGHAIIAFGVAVVLSHHFSGFRRVFFAGAVIASISRIYLGAHYPADVIIGGLIGIFITKAVLAVFDRGWSDEDRSIADAKYRRAFWQKSS